MPAILKTVLRPTQSAFGYTCFNSPGVFQSALRTTAYQDSRLAFASECSRQNASRAPRFMTRIDTVGSHNENSLSTVLVGLPEGVGRALRYFFFAFAFGDGTGADFPGDGAGAGLPCAMR